MIVTKALLPFLVIGFSFLFVHPCFASSLQQQLDDAQPYQIIDLQGNEYTEPLTITKPLTIKKAILRNHNNQPALTIRSNDVKIENITIIDTTENQQATLDIVGNNITLLSNNIQTNRMGIKVHKSTNITIQNNTLIGNGSENGIHLTHSTKGRIDSNRSANTRDGIYVEYCSEMLVNNNNIRQGRYGVHIMFGENHRLQRNTVDDNIIGFMVMSTNHPIINQNTIINQLHDVNASGITIFDVTNCEMTNNQISNNRYGVILQNSQKNTLTNNQFLQNIVAMQFLQATKNTFTNNNFIGNAISGENVQSSNNSIIGNYWDNAITMNWSGGNRSNVPYPLQSFFIRLQRLNSGYSLLFNQPGLEVLEALMPPTKESTLVDEAPLLSPLTKQTEEKKVPSIPWYSFGSVVVLSYFWLLGRRLSK